MRKVFVLALALQVIWNFGTEGLMKEFGGTEYEDRGQICFTDQEYHLEVLQG